MADFAEDLILIMLWKWSRHSALLPTCLEKVIKSQNRLRPKHIDIGMCVHNKYLIPNFFTKMSRCIHYLFIYLSSRHKKFIWFHQGKGRDLQDKFSLKKITLNPAGTAKSGVHKNTKIKSLGIANLLFPY